VHKTSPVRPKKGEGTQPVAGRLCLLLLTGNRRKAMITSAVFGALRALLGLRGNLSRKFAIGRKFGAARFCWRRSVQLVQA